MVTLKCDVRTCTYNKENCCCKGDISVGGKSACDCSQTCCDSFKEAKGDHIRRKGNGSLDGNASE